MTRQEWAERLPLIQAFVEGKTIQVKGWHTDDKWKDTACPSFDRNFEYRIKPEPKVIWVSDDWEVFEEKEDVMAYCQRHNLNYEKYVEVIE